jgi:transketolase
MTYMTAIEEKAVNTIRCLAMDAVQAANSGHPGTPMAMAPVAYCLWNRFLRFDPDDPIWPNRDRFVLSMGHASMLIYSMLHLTGVKAVNAQYERLGQPSVTLDDIKSFRQAIRSTAGHRASRRRPDRSGKAWPPASAWRSPASGRPRTSTGPASRCSITTCTLSAETAA